jgi:carboxylesterase type B
MGMPFAACLFHRASVQSGAYTQAVSSNKRAAQSKVVKMMVPNLGEMEVEKLSQNGR